MQTLSGAFLWYPAHGNTPNSACTILIQLRSREQLREAASKWPKLGKKREQRWSERKRRLFEEAKRAEVTNQWRDGGGRAGAGVGGAVTEEERWMPSPVGSRGIQVKGMPEGLVGKLSLLHTCFILCCTDCALGKP